MEKYDVAIIGGGSAGLAALKHLSNLGKQAILIEAGSKIGSKNLSGGILYSKKPKKQTERKYTNISMMMPHLKEKSQNTSAIQHQKTKSIQWILLQHMTIRQISDIQFL